MIRLSSREEAFVYWARMRMTHHYPKLGSSAVVEQDTGLLDYLAVRFVGSIHVLYPSSGVLAARFSSGSSTANEFCKSGEMALLLLKQEKLFPELRSSPVLVTSPSAWTRLVNSWISPVSSAFTRLAVRWGESPYRYTWKLEHHEHIVQTADHISRDLPVVFDPAWLTSMEEAVRHHVDLDREYMDSRSSTPSSLFSPVLSKTSDGSVQVVNSLNPGESTSRRRVITCTTCGCRKVSHTPCGMCGNFQQRASSS